MINSLLQTDFYKVGHIFQYPEGTQYIQSNMTARSGKWSNVPNNGRVVVATNAAVQYLIEDFQQNFFDRPLAQVMEEYKSVIEPAIGPLKNYDHIAALHKLGYLPLRISALPDGSEVPYNVPFMLIENTLPEFYWVTNYIETMLSALIWKPMTSATTALAYRRLMDKNLAETSDNPWFAWFQGHDFSARGMSHPMDAVMSGIGHLFSFKGTDTVAAIAAANRYYGLYDSDYGPVGCSVPATEHSCMSIGGMESEIDTYNRLITTVYPTGIVSIVSDTWDFWNVLTNYTVTLKEKIMARDGKVVFRPDSGDPVKIICGDPEAAPGSPEFLGAVRVLDGIFGHSVNSKGYKVLCPKVGLIYGDSITYERAEAILNGLKALGYSGENIVFGIGSYTYQNVTRDTHGFAIKATWAMVDYISRPIFKNPKTDNGSKKSHRGRLNVVRENGEFKVQQDCGDVVKSAMEIIYHNNHLSFGSSLCDIRRRLHG